MGAEGLGAAAGGGGGGASAAGGEAGWQAPRQTSKHVATNPVFMPSNLRTRNSLWRCQPPGQKVRRELAASFHISIAGPAEATWRKPPPWFPGQLNLDVEVGPDR